MNKKINRWMWFFAIFSIVLGTGIVGVYIWFSFESERLAIWWAGLMTIAVMSATIIAMGILVILVNKKKGKENNENNSD